MLSIRFFVSRVQNNQGLGECYQGQPSVSADNTSCSIIITSGSSRHLLVGTLRFKVLKENGSFNRQFRYIYDLFDLFIFLFVSLVL